MAHYSPLRYPGGKNCIFSFMSELIKDNKLTDYNYAEPYAGGCGLALRLLFEGYVDNIYINDLDRSIYAFWKVVLEDSERFCEWISTVDVSIKNWEHYRKIQQDRDKADLYELAQSTFFLNRTNVSGVIKGGVIGGQNQTGKYKLHERFNKEKLIVKIQKIAEYKSRIKLSNLDSLEFIDHIEKNVPKTFVYLDPPYYKKGSSLYLNFYKEDDHIKLAKRVLTLKNPWLVSYDDNEFILNLYKSQTTLSYSLSQSTSNRVGTELLVFSDKLTPTNATRHLKNPELKTIASQSTLPLNCA